jgi:hypothetical protein
MSLQKPLRNASDVFVSPTFGTKIAKLSHGCSSQVAIVAISMSRRDTAGIADALPTVGVIKC